VIELRKVPLFVRIGLMWWVVLLAYSLSRPFVLYAFPFVGFVGSESFSTSPIQLRGCVSLVHALVAGWVVVRWLQSYRGAGASMWGLAGWSILIAVFAVVAWWIVYVSMSMFEPGSTLVERLGRVAFGLIWLPYAVYLAFRMYWLATWVLMPLAVATVLLVRQDQASPRGTSTASGQQSA